MKTHRLIATAILSFFALFLYNNDANACSRIVYEGNNSLIVVGRSLDWKTPIPTNIYVYPRGMEKQGNRQENSVRWRSRYGAVYAVSYDGGITEGMNEMGLVINGLFCKGTVYSNADTENRPPMSLAVFVAWLLDMNATTDEVVSVLKQHNFNISGATFDGGTVSALHWGITDASGKTAILEFDNGKVNIYEDTDLQVLTNDPAFPKMQAILNYWHNIGGINMLPGTVKSPDRYVRADFFTRHVRKTADADTAASIARSIVMNVSVPYLYNIETEPNVSSTQWRSLANTRDKRYYFDIVTNSGMFYIDLNHCNIKEGAPVLKLDTSKSSKYVGDVTSKLVKSKPFNPMY